MQKWRGGEEVRRRSGRRYFDVLLNFRDIREAELSFIVKVGERVMISVKKG